jgi:hypothetical protein
MPYSRNSELPDWVKENFPADVQTDFRDTFNSAFAQYKDEGKAMATAIAMLHKKGYVKKGDKWVKAESFRKDILPLGVVPHPNDPAASFVVDDALVRKLSENSNKFMHAGGKIPITISHPKNAREKISEVTGWIKNVGVSDLDRGLFIDFDTDDESASWIKSGKVQAVSPGIVYEAVTSHGKFDVLLDHVALTNSPHFLGQSAFVPLTADRFSEAYLFFEGGIVGHANFDDARGEDGKGGIVDELKRAFGELQAQVKQLFEVVTGKNKEEDKDKGDEMKELEAAQKELEAVTKERDDYKAKLAAIEAERRKTQLAEFEQRVDKDVKELKIDPAEKPALLLQFERLSKDGAIVQLEGKEAPVADVVLKPFEARKSKGEVALAKDSKKIRFEANSKLIEFDVTTPEGKNAFAEYVMNRAKAEGKLYKEVRSMILAEARSQEQEE